jgi:riboflavin kinase, archaea type
MVVLEPVLVALADKMGSSARSLDLTTGELGRLLEVSQQTASRYLAELEGKGWIVRAKSGRGFNVKLTPDGVNVLKRIHAGIGRFLEPELKQAFEGIIASGIGEGAYYVKEYASRIEEAVGYAPYPGTLNVRFKGEKPDVNTDKTIEIAPFTSGERSFGRVGLTPVKLHVRGNTIDGHVIIPERTHHRRDIELIAGNNLREIYDLTDGEAATIIFS